MNQLDQALKSSFLTNMFLWMKLYGDIGVVPLINFVNWLGFC